MSFLALIDYQILKMTNREGLHGETAWDTKYQGNFQDMNP
jgi:hypothetical protein